MSAKTMLQSQKTAPPAFMPANHAILQRQCACGGNPGPSGECESCRQKRLASQAPLIQPKLTIGQPNDPYEQEADRVADAVMRMPDPKVQHQPDEEKKEDDDEEVVQTKPIAGQITPLVQTQAVPNHMPEVTPTVEANINALKGSGRPLDPATRAFMEPRFGHDFSQVRVHTDAKAAESARAVNALAYTTGKDVVFGAGQYAPQTSTGQRLLAHELTHVAQRADGLSRKQTIDLLSISDTIHCERDENQTKQEDQSGREKGTRDKKTLQQTLAFSFIRHTFTISISKCNRRAKVDLEKIFRNGRSKFDSG